MIKLKSLLTKITIISIKFNKSMIKDIEMSEVKITELSMAQCRAIRFIGSRRCQFFGRCGLRIYYE